MKQLWTEKYNCKYAIKVIHSNGDFPLKMELYDRFQRCVFIVKNSCSEHDGCEAAYNRAIRACYDYANQHGNNDEWIYVHNPYFQSCANIKFS